MTIRMIIIYNIVIINTIIVIYHKNIILYSRYKLD